MSGCGTAAAVVGAGVSVAGATGLLGGGGNQGQSSTGSSTPNVPSWMLPYLQQNASTASSLAANPYQPYTGTQVQPLSDMQNQAGTMSQNLANTNAVGQGMNAANAVQTGVAQQGLNGLNPQTMQNYMNPYTQNVINATNLKAQQQEQLQQNQLQAQEGQTGAFGGSRASLAQGQLQSNFAQNMMAQNATMNQNNFSNAENMGMQGLGQANSAAQGMMQSTAGAQTGQLQNIGALQTAGGLQQTTGQNQLNAQYQDFLTQQAYPYQNLTNSQNILNPIASLTTGSNATGFTQQTGQPGIAQALIGGATAGAGLNNAINGNTGFANMFNGNTGNSNSVLSNIGGQIGLDMGMQPNTNGQGAVAAAAWQQAYSENKQGGMVPGYQTGGMIPHGMYADGGKVVVPSLADHINHFMGQYAQHFEKGGWVRGEEVKSDLPGIPTQYGMTASETPYTNQKPKYQIPAYKAGGKIPLTTGLPMAGVPGIKRERQHWGKPYVPQTKNDSGYLRPDIKNALKTGGLAGIPQFSNGGLTAHYDDGGAIAPSLAMINADANGGQDAIDQLLNSPTPALTGEERNIEQGMYAPSNAQGVNVPQGATVGGLPLSMANVNATADAVNNQNGSLASPAPTQGGFSLITPAEAAEPDQVTREFQAAQKQRQAELAATGQLADNNSSPASVIPVDQQALSGPQGAKPGTDDFYKNTWNSLIDNTSQDIAMKTPTAGASPLSRLGTSLSNLGSKAVNTTNAAIRSPYDFGHSLVSASFDSTDEAKQVFNDPKASQEDKAAAAQYLMSQMAPSAKTQAAQVAKAIKAQPASAQVNANSSVSAQDETASTDKDLTPSERMQEMLLNRMQDKMTNGVNLPLLAMGSAILGNRSNSLAGALGAGGEAYTKTAQSQQQMDLESLQKMMMGDYYRGRNNIQQERINQNQPYINAKIAKLEQQPAGSDGRKQYDIAVQNGLKNGLSAQAAKEQAAAAFPDESSVTPTATPAVGTTATNPTTGHTMTWNGNGWQ